MQNGECILQTTIAYRDGTHISHVLSQQFDLLTWRPYLQELPGVGSYIPAEHVFQINPVHFKWTQTLKPN